MNMPIRTNKLKIKFDVEAFRKQYSVFKVQSDDAYIKRGALILDAPLQTKNNIFSIYFEKGRAFYVLMKKNETNRADLLAALGHQYTLSEVFIEESDKRVALSLLLNAIGSYESEMLRFNNLTGHLYVTNPAWLQIDEETNVIYQVYGLEFGITKDLSLSMKVKTFTAESRKKSLHFPKGKSFSSYPQYVLEYNHTLRRKLAGDQGETFINRQFAGVKSSINYIDLSKRTEKINATKMMVLARVVEYFNDKYAGVCHLDFQAVDEYFSLDTRVPISRDKKYQELQKYLGDCKVNIVDMVDDAVYCQRLKEAFKENFNKVATVSKRPRKECLNFIVLHTPEYYLEKNLPDPYRKDYPKYTVQHFTYEAHYSKKDLSTLLYACLYELLIKHDIKSGRITLFDWQKLGLQDDLIFGVQVKEQLAGTKNLELLKYFFMRIKPNGSFILSQEESGGLFTIGEYDESILAMQGEDNLIGVIAHAAKNIYLLRNTEWFTVPELDDWKREVEETPRSMRSQKDIERFFLSLTNIKMYRENKSIFYFVGESSHGLNSSIHNAANIRELVEYQVQDVEFDFSKLMSLMDITSIRKGQLTVVPFPFKYLREYVRTVMSDGERQCSKKRETCSKKETGKRREGYLD